MLANMRKGVKGCYACSTYNSFVFQTCKNVISNFTHVIYLGKDN